MPIYEYECLECGKKFELWITNLKKPLDILCPLCYTTSIKKLVSQNSFQLKGTGWYKTDYKKEKGEKNE